jgi:hypothetical protein
MESKIVFPDAAVRDDENPTPNTEDSQKIGAFTRVSKGIDKSIHKIAGGNKIALPTAPTAQIS